MDDNSFPWPKCRLEDTIATMRVAIVSSRESLSGDDVSEKECRDLVARLREVWVELGNLIGEYCCCWHPTAGRDLPTYLGRAAGAVSCIRRDTQVAWHLARDPSQVLQDINQHLYLAEQALHQAREEG